MFNLFKLISDLFFIFPIFSEFILNFLKIKTQKNLLKNVKKSSNILKT